MALLHRLQRAARARRKWALRWSVAGEVLSFIVRSGLAQRALGALRTPAWKPMGGDRLREVPDNVVPLHPRRDTLDDAIGTVMAEAAEVHKKLSAYMLSLGFKQSYVDAVMLDLVEAWTNEDEQPIWNNPNYVPPTKDV